MIRQLSAFVGVGVVASALHYAVLIALVELCGIAPVPAALSGFAAGGVLSYGLNRRHTFVSDRPHDEAAWRFALVAGVAFGLTYAIMRLLVDYAGAPYLPAQVVTTLIVMIWTFVANRLWTFHPSARRSPSDAQAEDAASTRIERSSEDTPG